MPRLVFLLLILILSPDAFTLHAQAHPGCPVRPQTLAAMRGCYRPILIFAPAASDSRLAAQRDALDQAADDMMDRNMLLVPILGAGASSKAPLDAPFAVLATTEIAAARRRYGVAPGVFRVVLLGEDGEAKLRSDAPMPVKRFFDLIDSMPMRQLEMQRPHAN